VHGQSLEEARTTGFAAPPPRKAQGPIVDAHTHITEPATNHELIEAARVYRIATLVAIAPLDAGLALREQYPREVTLAVRPVLTEPRGQIALLDRAVETVYGAKAHGAPLIKLWFAPRIRDRLDFLLDSPRLDPMFQAIAETGLGVLVHVSDPDRWFERKYDPAKYGTKAEQYPMLETRLRQFPTIPFLAAHMGANRICFGTDQVVLKDSEPVRYTMRYWVHQMFWETDLVCASPIADPDSDGVPSLRGLDLPVDVLEQIYWKTAEAAFGIGTRPSQNAPSIPLPKAGP
jgi:predicted TIM-barrel fold metal-dependent hydrolase